MIKKTPIQLKLLAAGISRQDIVEATGLTYKAVDGTLRGRFYNQAVQEYTAKRLGKKPAKLWREDYAPIRRKLKRKNKQP